MQRRTSDGEPIRESATRQYCTETGLPPSRLLTYYLLLITYYSLLITHYSLLDPMSYKVKTYNPIAQGTFNPDQSQRLYGFNVEPITANLGIAGGVRFIRNMSAVATDGKLLKRAKLLTGAAAADLAIYVNNPWAFAVGDALRVIAAPNTPAATELAAIIGATGASLGTISSIDSIIDTQSCRITPASAVAGNVITVDFLGISASYAVATTVLIDELVKLAKAINKAIRNCESLRYVTAIAYATYVAIVSTQPAQIVEFTASIVQGTGASLALMTTSTDTGLGKLTLSAPLPAALVQGTKVGTVTQIPLGIFDGEYDFTSYPNAIVNYDAITPVYGGQFYLSAMPYIDGQITSVLTNARFMPAYV